MKQVGASLKDLLASVVNSLGYEFVGCELHSQGRGSLLRVYIDHEQGINLDNCSEVSYQISAMLDVEDPIQGSYTLEVSSPGLERPLFELAHFTKHLGHKVKVRLIAPIGNRRNIVGVLTKVEGTNLHLRVDDAEMTVPYSEVEKAKLVIDY